MPIRGSPNGAHHPPSTGWSRSPGMGGRDQSERLVAINRNRWSQSAGARRLVMESLIIGVAIVIALYITLRLVLRFYSPPDT
jgi:hypothetical protein